MSTFRTAGEQVACATCGAVFAPNNENHKFCAPICRPSNIPRKQFICRECWKPFDGKSNGKYCHKCGPKKKKELARKAKKRWAMTHPERVRELQRKNRLKNYEKISQRIKEWRIRNPLKVYEARQKWYKANIEKIRARDRLKTIRRALALELLRQIEEGTNVTA